MARRLIKGGYKLKNVLRQLHSSNNCKCYIVVNVCFWPLTNDFPCTIILYACMCYKTKSDSEQCIRSTHILSAYYSLDDVMSKATITTKRFVFALSTPIIGLQFSIIVTKWKLYFIAGCHIVSYPHLHWIVIYDRMYAFDKTLTHSHLLMRPNALSFFGTLDTCANIFPAMFRHCQGIGGIALRTHSVVPF